MIPDEIIRILNNWFCSEIDTQCRITGFSSLYGGSINNNFAVNTTRGNFFLKYNKSSLYPGMFKKEKLGLEILSATKTVYIPKVLCEGETSNYGFLLMNLEKQVNAISGYWKILGIQLAELHKITSPEYGLDYDNYIGSLKQRNNKHTSYTEFFIGERLEPLIKSAYESNALTHNDIHHFHSLYKRLPEIIPDEKPSLIHGDLWSGNVIVNSKGFPCLIDPAVYYGHRESDIAMSKLFGGFGTDFYIAYNDEYPIYPGWEDRIGIHQLYPLLVHVNLFGGGYSASVREIISKF